MDYKEKYKQAIERCKSWAKGEHPECFCEAQKAAEFIFPELKESEDERIRKEMISWLKGFIGEEEGYGYTEDEIRERIAWLEKQGECVIDCHQNHQDSNRPSGGIVLEDFNGGEGFYKLNLAYLNKKQVEEVEEMVREWNNEPTASEEDIKDCIGLCLTDADEQRFKNYHTNLRDCLAWLDKQCEQKQVEENKGNVGKISSAWSEEDEYQINTILYGLDLKRKIYKKEGNKVEEERYNIQYDWLKQLKNRVQPHWKPTEEQMSMLLAVLDDSNNITAESVCIALKSLYNDLKKL